MHARRTLSSTMRIRRAVSYHTEVFAAALDAVQRCLFSAGNLVSIG